ncbi:MAG: phosphoribulokinase [Sulfitobacter sp.]
MIDLEGIVTKLNALPLHNGRRIIAIAGAPASGKSTLAHALHLQMSGSCVLPMDGFHRSNEDLEAHGLLSRKGAPETFDVVGFTAIIKAVRSQTAISVPTFDRTNDCVVSAGASIGAADTTVLVEGNYLLLDEAPWRDLAHLWDYSILLETPMEELQKRLVARWLTYGHEMEGATRRAEANDLPNARRMMQHALSADLVVRSTG